MSENALLNRYARIVDTALRGVLTGHERPLIITASEPLASIYRAVSSYPHTSQTVIGGNADRTPDHELAASAREVLDAINAERLKALAALYSRREDHGRATTDIVQAAKAATFGAIDTLIVDMNASVPGTVDDDTGLVTFADGPSADTYDVIDEIVSRAMKAGAKIIAARGEDVPGGGPLAAITRYAF